MSTLFFPVITFLLLTVCIFYWVITAVYPSEWPQATAGIMGGATHFVSAFCSSELRESCTYVTNVHFLNLFGIQTVENEFSILSASNQLVRWVFNLHCEISYLASSGEAIYKVTSPDVGCPYANSTCKPEVQYILLLYFFVFLLFEVIKCHTWYLQVYRLRSFRGTCAITHQWHFQYQEQYGVQYLVTEWLQGGYCILRSSVVSSRCSEYSQRDRQVK